jgi:hypothetical protein
VSPGEQFSPTFSPSAGTLACSRSIAFRMRCQVSAPAVLIGALRSLEHGVVAVVLHEEHGSLPDVAVGYHDASRIARTLRTSKQSLFLGARSFLGSGR